MVLWSPTRPSRTNTKKKKKVIFIIGDWNAKVGSQEIPGVIGKFGLEYKRNRAKDNRVLPRECTGHSKHPLPTTQETTLHMDIIDMNLPWVYMCSPSWTPYPPLSPFHPSGSSQCTSPEHPVSCIEPGLAIILSYVSHMIIYMFQCYSLKSSHPHLLPQSPKTLLYICVSFAVSHIGSLLPSL